MARLCADSYVFANVGSDLRYFLEFSEGSGNSTRQRRFAKNVAFERDSDIRDCRARSSATSGLGRHTPGVTILAYIAAIWLIVGGAAILWRRSLQFAFAKVTLVAENSTEE